MTDSDESLQDRIERHVRGDASMADMEDDPDAAAYETVFSALEEEPEGTLPEDFSARVANRVGLGPEPVLRWIDLLPLVLAVVALPLLHTIYPAATAPLSESVDVLIRGTQALSEHVRLDVLAATTLVFLLTVAIDAVVSRLPSLERVPSTS